MPCQSAQSPEPKQARGAVAKKIFDLDTTNRVRPLERLCNKKSTNVLHPLAPAEAVISTRTSATQIAKKRSHMHSKRIQLGLSACAWFFLVSVHLASGLQPPQPPTTPTVPPIIGPAPTPPGEGSLPVVINYGQGETTRVSIYRGMMEPVGVLPNQSVTVTVSFPVSRAGAQVSLWPYDGGQVGVVDPQRTTNIALNGVLAVGTDGTAQFNFQAGRTLGLYRVQMNVGSAQYLLRFYAGLPTGVAIACGNAQLCGQH